MAKNLFADKILILDFGSQYTQLIARRVRELGVYCEIFHHKSSIGAIKKFNPKGIILSGGPETVKQKGAPKVAEKVFELNIPILGICYGQQVLMYMLGGKVKKSFKTSEFGRTKLQKTSTSLDLLRGCFRKNHEDVWMSHGDSVCKIPEEFKDLAATDVLI